VAGGDPLKRPDLFDLLRKSVELGLRTTVSPSPTPLLTPEAIRGFKQAGVARISVSVDGWDAASHDDFRQVAGSFARAMAALEEAQRIGLSTQINTTETISNTDRFGIIWPQKKGRAVAPGPASRPLRSSDQKISLKPIDA